jgi:predicted dehydrogenase
MSGLGVGLVGFGRLAERYYAPALRRSRALRVVAIAEPLAERRRRAAAEWPAARGVASLADLVRSDGVEALLVASPPASHLAAWRAACAAGLPAFVEKPLVLTHQLAEIGDLGRDPRVMVDFNRRFWPAYQEIRRRVAADELGRELVLDFRLELDVDRWSAVTAHRGDAAQGGLVHDLGSHALDLAAWLLGGAPVELAASRLDARPASERWRLDLAFGDGSRAVLALAYGRRTRERLRLRGSGGRLRLDEPNLRPRVSNSSLRPSLLAPVLDAGLLVARFVRRSTSFGRASIAAALAAFAAAARAGDAFAPGGEEGLRNVRWVAAVERSAAAGGRPLRLDRDELGFRN